MNRFLNSTFLILGLCLCFQSAQAGILIEPYAGYGGGSYLAQTKTNPIFYDGATSGGMFGGRLGLSFLGAWVAADYMSTSPTMTNAKPIGPTSASVKNNMLFVDAGFDLPFLFRFWGGYGVSNYQKISYQLLGAPVEEVFKGGSAVKFGIGFKLALFFSINLEYIKPTFSKYEITTNGVSAGETDMGTQFSSSKQDMASISLSFPLNLL